MYRARVSGTGELEALRTELQTAACAWVSGEPPDVWVFDLRGFVLDGLSDAEIEATRSMSPLRKAEFLAGRRVLRAVIESYVVRNGAAVAPLRFYLRPGGKPGVKIGPEGRRFLSFNVSHSAGILAVAVVPNLNEGHEVGVDLELQSRAHLAPEPLQGWVRGEAILKCVGVGATVAEAAPDVATAIEATQARSLTREWRELTGGESWPALELGVAWSWSAVS